MEIMWLIFYVIEFLKSGSILDYQIQEMTKKYIEDIRELQQQGIESEIIGVAIGMINRTNLSKKVVHTIKQIYGNLVFETNTMRKSRIHEYSIVGFPERNSRGVYYAKDSDALFLHNRLIGEFLNRIGFPPRKEIK